MFAIWLDLEPFAHRALYVEGIVHREVLRRLSIIMTILTLSTLFAVKVGHMDFGRQTALCAVSFEGERYLILVSALKEVEVEHKGPTIDNTVGHVHDFSANLRLHRRTDRILALNQRVLH